MSKKTDVEVKREKAAPQPAEARHHNPFASLRHEIDRLFEDFAWPDFRFPLQRRLSSVEPVRHFSDVWATAPAMDLVERNGEFEVKAELPGMNIADIEVKLSDDMLTIKGEKTYEREEEDVDFHLRERSYGEFQRSFRLPGGIDTTKVEAKLENGVLSVRLPKTAEAKEKARKIEVKAA